MSRAIETTDCEEWLTLGEACALTGVSPTTLRRWSDNGDITSFTTPGGHRRFARSAILGLLPAARGRRPKLERLGETPERMAGVYRPDLAGACHGMPWISALGDEDLEPFRAHCRRLTRSLLGFIDATTPEERQMAIADASGSAAEYGRVAADCGMEMSDAVEAFLRIRIPFLRELASLATRRELDTAVAAELLEAATEAVDLLLGSLMRGYAQASGDGGRSATHRRPGTGGEISQATEGSPR